MFSGQYCAAHSATDSGKEQKHDQRENRGQGHDETPTLRGFQVVQCLLALARVLRGQLFQLLHHFFPEDHPGVGEQPIQRPYDGGDKEANGATNQPQARAQSRTQFDCSGAPAIKSYREESSQRNADEPQGEDGESSFQQSTQKCCPAGEGASQVRCGPLSGNAFSTQIRRRKADDLRFGLGLKSNPNLRRATLLAKQNTRLNRGSAVMASRFQFQFKLQQESRARQTGKKPSAIGRQSPARPEAHVSQKR